MKKKIRKKKDVLSNFVFDDYQSVREKISKKIGSPVKMSGNLPVGNWSKQALKVLEERYLLRDETGQVVESPEQMCWRVCWEIASADVLWGSSRQEVKKTAEEFYKLLISVKFLPNSPTLMNAGTGNGLQYSACFVLPVEDSLVGIFDALKYQALIHQTGGGTGFSFSRLRPKGSIVGSSKGVASGPVSFMRIFDSATNEIKQGGKRRGANMGILRVDHPDILEFIHCKDEGGITNFNISVGVTDDFIDALKNDSFYDLISVKSNASGETRQIVGKLSARKVWDEIVESAHRTGDPGIIFIDKINKGLANPVPDLGPIEATNPCGEQPLYPFDSCNLGSVFLNRFVKEEGDKKILNWNEMKTIVRTAMHFMDNVIEMNPYPLKQIRQTSLALRRVGVGVGGWADALIDLGIAYNSEEALLLAEETMRIIQKTALEESINLAKKRGPFPLWKQSIYSKGKPRRNSTVTTIAPTGSISIIANASSGIEPMFAIAYRHIVKDKSLDRTLTFINPKLKTIGEERGFWSSELENKVMEKGYISDISEIPEDIRKIFCTAHEIESVWHIRMQAAFQKYTDNAVSKTINLKNSATKTDVENAYLLALESGCKGITVFRDGCKDKQVLNTGLSNKDEEKQNENFQPLMERPFAAKGATYRLITPVGTAFITINEDDFGEPLELFINIGKAGSDVAAMAEALGRTISTALRFRGKNSAKDRAKEIALQLAGIGGRRSVGFGPNKILSLPDAIAFALSNHFGFKVNGFLNNQKEAIKSDYNKDLIKNSQNLGEIKNSQDNMMQLKDQSPTLNGVNGNNGKLQQPLFENSHQEEMYQAGDICPSCGAGSFVYQEGCGKCMSCAFSEC